MIMDKRWLSKSQVKIFQQCPMKWKYLYIDAIPGISSPAQNRGIDIHSKVERFYNNIDIVQTKEKTEIKLKNPDKDLDKFVEFENKRIQDCKDETGEINMSYFKPLFQELKVSNDELKLRGIIDAVYLNPKDNKLIIIDWKTGTPSGDMDDYRLELAIYKILYDCDTHINKVKGLDVGYWGIYFLDKGKLFFEPVSDKWVKKALNIINKVRLDIEKGEYKMKPSFWCRYCQFREKCGGNNVNI
jgi:CRISPR/Cas system-associated exonuclease Cas4 (RecB family)